MNLSPSVRVSGRAFKAFAALSFGTDMPSHVVMVVLKRIAASEKVLDGIVSSISVNDIGRLSGKLKDAFLEDYNIIKRCELTLKGSHVEDPLRAVTVG